MRVGFCFDRYDWPDQGKSLASAVRRYARHAEAAGFDSIWAVDHLFQAEWVGGGSTDPMLDGSSVLAHIAAITERVQLGLLVGGIHLRPPAVWIKTATTLDVLSGGRGSLGLGAGWNEDECRALGIPFPPLAERFEILEDTLRMAHAMWSGPRGSEADLQGKRVHASRIINNPQAISRPHPPILVGGMGARRTLRLVARYADACNVAGPTDAILAALAALRERCAEEGRRYEEIERTVMRPSPDLYGKVSSFSPVIVDDLSELHAAGVDHVIFSAPESNVDRWLDRLGSEVVPFAHALR